MVGHATLVGPVGAGAAHRLADLIVDRLVVPHLVTDDLTTASPLTIGLVIFIAVVTLVLLRGLTAVIMTVWDAKRKAAEFTRERAELRDRASMHRHLSGETVPLTGPPTPLIGPPTSGGSAPSVPSQRGAARAGAGSASVETGPGASGPSVPSPARSAALSPAAPSSAALSPAAPSSAALSPAAPSSSAPSSAPGAPADSDLLNAPTLTMPRIAPEVWMETK